MVIRDDLDVIRITLEEYTRKVSARTSDAMLMRRVRRKEQVLEASTMLVHPSVHGCYIELRVSV